MYQHLDVNFFSHFPRLRWKLHSSSVPILALLLLVGPATGAVSPRSSPEAGEAGPEIPATLQGEVVRELLEVLESPDPEGWQRFITEHFADDFRNVAPMEAHLGIFGGLWDESRGYRVQSFEETGENRYELLVQAELTGLWKRFVLTFEPGDPPRLSGLGVRSAEAPETAEPPSPLSSREMVERLDAFAERLARADVFSGTVLLARKGRPLYARAFGEADKAHRVPNHLDTKFSLGSMNKMFTAVAVAQLVEAGELSFDDPLSAHVPDVLDLEAAERIQIRHLLSHTSGLGDYLGEMRELPQDRFRTLDDFLALVRGDTPEFDPGEKRRYSNAGYLLLGRVIENLSGKNYYDYVRDRIYRPAGMTGAGSRPQDRVIPDLAVGYDKEFTEEGVRFRNNRFSIGLRGGPAGGGYAAALDLLAFATALQRGELVDRKLVEVLTSPKPELGSDRYGYGFSVKPERGIVGHSGGFAGVSANLDIFPEKDFVAVVLANYRGAIGPVVTKIRGLVERSGSSP